MFAIDGYQDNGRYIIDIDPFFSKTRGMFSKGSLEVSHRYMTLQAFLAIYSHISGYLDWVPLEEYLEWSSIR